MYTHGNSQPDRCTIVQDGAWVAGLAIFQVQPGYGYENHDSNQPDSSCCDLLDFASFIIGHRCWRSSKRELLKTPTIQHSALPCRVCCKPGSVCHGQNVVRPSPLRCKKKKEKNFKLNQNNADQLTNAPWTGRKSSLQVTWRPKRVSFSSRSMSTATHVTLKTVSHDQTDGIYTLFQTKMAKYIAFGAAHTYMAYMWESLPPPPLVILTSTVVDPVGSLRPRHSSGDWNISRVCLSPSRVASVDSRTNPWLPTS